MLRVSVICPVFNTRPEDLRAAVSSVIAQDSQAVQELILVDDFSTSGLTRTALDEVSNLDTRITVLRLPRNVGPASARNVGLDHASGDWVGFIDADDLWPADKLTRASITLAQRPEIGWIVGDFTNFSPNGQDPIKPGVSCFALEETADFPKCSPALTRCIILDGLHLGTCLVRRELIGRQRFNPAVSYGEDLLFLAKLSLSACAYRVPGLSYLCRRGQGSMMYSRGRISADYASGPRAGFRDPTLRRFRREYRWVLYDLYKELAVNNLLNRRPLAASGFALRALRIDPREINDFIQFIALLPCRDRAELARHARSYCKREQVALEDYGS